MKSTGLIVFELKVNMNQNFASSLEVVVLNIIYIII
jgi:hypothetical protein